MARKQTRRDEAAVQSEHILNLVEEQKGANLEFESNMEELLSRYDSYLLNEKQEYIGWKEEISRMVDNQK